MKILLVSQYFYPESFIINDLVKNLTSDGVEVTVLTGKPNYPDGKLFARYKFWGVQREHLLNGVEVIRVPLVPRRNGGALDLLLNYFSFVFFACFMAPFLLRGRKFDVGLVFAMSPITSAIPAIVLKALKRFHLAVWIQDLWPESLAATGFVRHPFLLKIVGLMVRAIYASADTLLIQSRAFLEPVARYVDEDKIIYYPNSIDEIGMSGNDIHTLPADLLRILHQNFCVVFAGNIGKAQSVNTIVDAAKRLNDLPDCKFVLVGSGSMLEWVRGRQAAMGLENLVLAGRFPMNMMSEIYSRSAGLLVTLKDERIFSYTIPSKIQAYLAAGKPIIAALNGEGASIVVEASAGFVCPSEDVDGLVACVRKLHGLPQHERDAMGAAGRKYFLENFEMGGQAKRLIEILESRVVEVEKRGG